MKGEIIPNLMQSVVGAASRPIFNQMRKCNIGIIPHTNARKAEIIAMIVVSLLNLTRALPYTNPSLKSCELRPTQPTGLWSSEDCSGEKLSQLDSGNFQP